MKIGSSIIFLFGGFLLVIAKNENPFLPVPDAPVPSKSGSNSQKVNNQQLTIREKTMIKIRPGVSGAPMEMPSGAMLIARGPQNPIQTSNPRFAVFASDDKERKRVALIPTPILGGNSRDEDERDGGKRQIPPPNTHPFPSNQRNPSTGNLNQFRQSESKVDEADDRDFFLTKNAEGNLVLFANSPLPKNGLIVMTKTRNGERTQMILRPAGETNKNHFDIEPINLNLPEVEEKDSEERAPIQITRPKIRNVIKISGDGSFIPLNTGDSTKDKNFIDSSSEENKNLIWSPSAGIKATRGKTPEEQWKIDEEQRAKLRGILKEEGKTSNPQPPILLKSDKDRHFPEPILVVSDIDPNHPRAILVHSDPDPSMPQPILIKEEIIQSPSNKPNPSRGMRPSVVPETGDQDSTETVAKKSDHGMRIEIPENDDPISDEEDY